MCLYRTLEEIFHVLTNVHDHTDDCITEKEVNEWLIEEKAGLGNEHITNAEIMQHVQNETECSDDDRDNG